METTMIRTSVPPRLSATRFFMLRDARTYHRSFPGIGAFHFHQNIIYPTDVPIVADTLAAIPSFVEVDRGGNALNGAQVGIKAIKAARPRSYVSLNKATIPPEVRAVVTERPNTPPPNIEVAASIIPAVSPRVRPAEPQAGPTHLVEVEEGGPPANKPSVRITEEFLQDARAQAALSAPEPTAPPSTPRKRGGRPAANNKGNTQPRVPEVFEGETAAVTQGVPDITIDPDFTTPVPIADAGLLPPGVLGG
jgi:hypothetical protein